MALTPEEQQKRMYEAGKAVASLEVLAKAEVIALGAGRTVEATLDVLSQNEAYKGKTIVCGSKGTEERARSLGIDFISYEEAIERNLSLDVYVDGADQIDPENNLIKGGPKVKIREGKVVFESGGDPRKEGCMYKEKGLAKRAKTFIVVADDSKLVSLLGANNYPLPVEYEPNKEREVRGFLEHNYGLTNLKPRKKTDGTDFVTENGNHIFDIVFDAELYNLATLGRGLERNQAIFSTGLFAARKPDIVIIAGEEGVVVKVVVK